MGQVVNSLDPLPVTWNSTCLSVHANAVIRNSIAVESCSSAFSFGVNCPSSTFAFESGGDEKCSVSQMHTGVGLRSPGKSISIEHVSCVSFAPDTRGSCSSTADSRHSTDSRRTIVFHSSRPSLPDTNSTLSPRQSKGPLTLTPDDIRARILPSEISKSGNDIDEVIPALRSELSHVKYIFLY